MAVTIPLPPEELLQRAGGLVPLIESKSAWAEENRRLHDDVVAALADAGIFDLRRPARYGGYEIDARTLVDVLATLARGDGAAGWNAAVWSICSFMAGMFPDHVQDEVFATPAARVCAVLSPTAVATATDGGLVVNGRWRFMSGAQHSHWQVILAMAPAPGGGQWPVMALVPMAELAIDDDWHTSGLSGTGSVTTIATDLFVPHDRVLPMPLVLQGRYASAANSTSPVFTGPMMPNGALGFSAVALGLARAALAAFLERLPDRKITYTAYPTQAEAPVTHLQVAEASLRIGDLEHNVYWMADLLDRKGAAGEEWTIEERIRVRASLGRAITLAKEAVDILAGAGGGSSIYLSEPIQRIQRDLQAVSLHALMNPNTNLELYGRTLCGLEPNTQYV